jgi:hypothetical protein
MIHFLHGNDENGDDHHRLKINICNKQKIELLLIEYIYEHKIIQND